MSATYETLRETIEVLAAAWDADNPDYQWAVSPTAKAQSLRALERLEAEAMPCPLLCTENEGRLAFIWQAGDWKLYQTFGGGEVDYLFLPNKGGKQRSIADHFPVARSLAQEKNDD